MKNTMFFLMISLFLLPTSACKDHHPFDRVYSFWVKNKSDELIQFLVSNNYPDTLIPDNYHELKAVSVGSKTPYDSKEKWEKVFDKLPSDTLSIFIFSSDTISIYDWQTIRNDYKILKRYDVSIDDLYQKNGIISYP